MRIAGLLLVGWYVICAAAVPVRAQLPVDTDVVPVVSLQPPPIAPERPSFEPDGRPIPQVPRLPDVDVIAEAPLPAQVASPRSPPSTTTLNPFDQLLDVGRGQTLLGEMGSASAGRIGQAQLQYRPLLRPGEVFEAIPGVIVTQHSGSGKANQWFLRGFNLDHGTDFSVKVDNVPMNLPTHAHGQGYLDVNFIIPELVQFIDYKKGPYYAEQGDFSSAGGAEMTIMNRLPTSINKAGVGSFGFFRSLNANSFDVGQGHALVAFEYQHYDGPWVVPERFEKYNGLMKYTLGDDDFGSTLSSQAYYGEWTSTDQIPLRAVQNGTLPLYGTINPTDGGVTTRFINNWQTWKNWGNGSVTKANVYAQYYQLDLYNDFTFFLDDPVNGDQFVQRDRRAVVGAMLSHEWTRNVVVGRDLHTVVGAQLREDIIPEVQLQHTANRQVLNTTRNDKVNQQSIGIYMSRTRRWTDKLRTIVGTRGDFYNFDVTDRIIADNTGFIANGIWSPKATIAYEAWEKTEYFANWGFGFHSNDARGTVTHVDPVSLQPVDSVTPLVRSNGYELGLRSSRIENLNTQFAVWYLDLQSELLFVGDAGTTVPSRATRRYGFEWSNYYVINPWLRFDLDIADTHARFVEDDPAGNYIPGAIGRTINTGPTITLQNGLFSSLRLRHFGPRPLIEDNSVNSNSTTLLDLKFGYQRRRFQCGIDIFNTLATTNHDIDYYYTSRLPGEPAAGVDDVHFHPVEKTAVRGYVNLAW